MEFCAKFSQRHSQYIASRTQKLPSGDGTTYDLNVRPLVYQQTFLDNAMMERTIIADSNPIILKALMAYTVSEYYSFLIARYNASEKVRIQIEKQNNKNNKK